MAESGNDELPPTTEELDNQYFRPFGFEGTFYRVYKLFIAQWFVFLVINTLAFLVMLGSTLVLFFFVMGDLGYAADHGNDAGFEVYFAVMIEVVVFYSIQCIADGAIIQAVALVYAGQKPTVAGCIRAAAGKLCSLIGSSITVASMIVVPSLLLLTWASSGTDAVGVFFFLLSLLVIYVCWVFFATYLTYSTVVVEGKGACGSVLRSYHLTNGNFCYILSTLLIFSMIKLVVNVVVSSLVGAGHLGTASLNDNGGGSLVVDFNLGGPGDGVVKIVLGILFAALGSIFQAVIFFNTLVRSEGVTSTKVAEMLGLEGDENAYGMIADKKDEALV